jgi:hypothetical protein
MNELTGPVRFIFWIGGVVIAMGLFGSFGHMTYKMAETAIEAQEHQMSYGKFSHMLWSQGKQENKAAH